MRVHEITLGTFLLGLSGFWFVSAAGFPETPGQDFGPDDFPRIVAVGLAICGAFLFASGAADLARNGRVFTWVEERFDRSRLVDVATIIASVIFYYVFAPVMGFPFTVFLCVLVLCLRFGGGVISAAVFAITVAATLYVVFAMLLQVALPLGPLGALLYD